MLIITGGGLITGGHDCAGDDEDDGATRVLTRWPQSTCTASATGTGDISEIAENVCDACNHCLKKVYLFSMESLGKYEDENPETTHKSVTYIDMENYADTDTSNCCIGNRQNQLSERIDDICFHGFLT